MSNTIRLSSRSRRTTSFRREAWSQLFGSLLREAREERGRSVEEAAEAAGMSTSEWEAVEAGQVPETWEKVRRMAGWPGNRSQLDSPARPVLPGGLGIVTLRGPGSCEALAFVLITR